jgi:hypothetical protein
MPSYVGDAQRLFSSVVVSDIVRLTWAKYDVFW